MLAELEKGPTRATDTSENQLALRKKMTQELIIEESKHEALEEMYFWPAVREHLTAGNTLADEATRQEQEAKQVLADLDKLDASDAQFEKLLAKFTVAAGQAARLPAYRTVKRPDGPAKLGRNGLPGPAGKQRDTGTQGQSRNGGNPPRRAAEEEPCRVCSTYWARIIKRSSGCWPSSRRARPSRPAPATTT